MDTIRIGVYICWCGTNIAKMIDVQQVAESIKKLPNVEISKNYKYMCSDPGQDLLLKDIKKHNLNRIVVAACSPRIHELTFRKALENAGLNPYLFEMANIREQDSWVHTNRKTATRKALSLVTAAVSRVQFHEELSKRTVEVNPATLIIGGGISGLTAALEIANAGKQVFLIEKSNKLGGNLRNIVQTYPDFGAVADFLSPMIKRVRTHPFIQLFQNAQVDNLTGYVGNFKAGLKSDKDLELEFGSIIVATGLKTFDPTLLNNYKYNNLDNVVTSLEFEDMIRHKNIRTKEGLVPKSIALLHCVGSRDKDTHPYCSFSCCGTALKYSNFLSDSFPEMNIYQLYVDMRTFGKGCEELYTQTSRKNVMFLQFDKNKRPEVISALKNDQYNLIIEMDEQLSGESIEVPADLVVLMVGMEARLDNKELAHTVGISCDNHGFFIEKHPKLDPVATTTDAVFIVGNCQAPKGISESVSQAKAASCRVLGLISKGSVEVEVTTSCVNEDICCGCQTCVNVCPYSAVSYSEENEASQVNEVQCKGCGTCGASCPAGAIKCRHFTSEQILSEIKGLLAQEG